MRTVRQNSRRAVALTALSLLALLGVFAAPAVASTPLFLRAFGPEGFTGTSPIGAFTNLQGIAVDQSSGDVYAYDAGTGSIYKFNAAGEPADFSGLGTNVITGADEPHKNEGELAVDNSTGAAKGDIYVSTGVGLNHVLIFNPAGEPATPTGEIKEEPGVPWGELCGVATDTAGDVYVALYESNEESHVNKYTATGEYVSSLYHLNNVCNIAVDAEGNVYTGRYGEEGEVLKYAPSQFYPPPVETSAVASTPMPFAEHGTTLAIDEPTNELFIDDAAVIAQYTSSGEDLGTFGEGLTESFGVAVNYAGGQVYVDDTSEVQIFGPAPELPGQWSTEPATEVTTTAATLNGTVDPEGAAVTACEFEYGTSSTYGHSAPCEQTSTAIATGAIPVKVSAKLTGLEPGTKYYFRVLGVGAKGASHGRQESFTTHETPPRATVKPVTAVSAHCATFNGEVNPNGFATTYRFEDSADGTTWTSLGQTGAGSASGETSVTQEICGLSGSTTYDLRLTAENGGGNTTSSTETFATPVAEPQIEGVGVTVLGGGEATLYATIHPEKQATSYRFDYGTTSAYGTSAPAGEGDAGTTTAQVTEPLTGLLPGTIYHFRIVATNPTGTISSADKTFMTSLIAPDGQPAAPGLCPNETLRQESNISPRTGAAYSTELPDCRAYEQVTPPFKGVNGVGAGGLNELAGYSTAVEGVSPSGSPLLAKSLAPLDHTEAGADGEINPTTYELARTTSGWATTGLTPAASEFATARDAWMSPGEATTGVWAAATPDQSINAEDFYRRERNGTFVDIGPIAPPAATAGPRRGSHPGTLGLNPVRDTIVGASANLEDVVYQLDSQTEVVGTEPSYLWPGNTTASGIRPSLYEYVGTGHTGEATDVPTAVGVDNEGDQIGDCGTGLGGDTESQARPVRNGISAGGSTVFFNVQAGGCATGAGGPPVPQVYARLGTPGTRQATVNVAGSNGCATSATCNVTSAVAFQGASADGSAVFFTAAHAGLVPGGADGTNALYECELPGDNGSTPSTSGKVDPCPALRVLSSTGTSEGAEVQNVLAVSEEGSRVFFTAKGLLTSDPDRSLPAGRQVAEAGKDNLYVWEAVGSKHSAGRVAYIATLPSASPTEFQATPDGDYLVFTTTADLTPDDTSAVAQAFRYEALTGELIRISVGQNGFANDGNTDSYSSALAPTRNTPSGAPRTVSEDGAYVAFQTSAALTPQAEGGASNVYEWHEGSVYLISDGADTSEHAGLLGIDASGENLFFVTTDQLVGQDDDQDYDIYDARIDGGFPKPVPLANCSGESCQGPLSSGLAPSPLISSTGAPAVGNLASRGLHLPGERPALTPTRKPVTRAQKLRNALHVCHNDKRKAKRKRCERTAMERYPRGVRKRRK